MKRYALILSLCALTLSCCADPDSLDHDFCPDDPSKLAPGTCGCGIPDIDSDGNGLLDCLEGKTDQCPNDPNKVTPGICGCGTPDVDTDGDGVYDCNDECPEDPTKIEKGVCGCGVTDVDSDGVISCADTFDFCPLDDAKTQPGACGCGHSDEDSDGDTIPDCIDACPNNATKSKEGFCGCDLEDSAENVRDADHDGVPFCLDACPNNPTKSSADDGDCEKLDSDRDGVDDEEDACPNNAEITTKLVDAPQDLNCASPIDTRSFIAIQSAEDLKTLRSRLTADDIPGNQCITEGDNIFVPKCMDDQHLLTCENNVIILKACSCETQQATDSTPASGDCTGTAIHIPAQPLNILVENDINLADVIDTVVEADGSCHSNGWTPISSLFNANVLSDKGATLSYSVDGQRCTLENALFNEINRSSLTNLVIDIDFNGQVEGSLANQARDIQLDHIVMRGSLVSDSTAAVGGLIGTILEPNFTQSILIDCYADNANIFANQANAAGGLIGESNNVTILATDTQNSINSLYGRNYVGGLIGYAYNSAIIDVKNSVKSIRNTNQGSSLGGLIGYANYLVAYNIINNVDVIDNTINYTGGFVGYLHYGSIDHLTNHVNKINATSDFVGGAIGYTSNVVDLSNIMNEVGELKTSGSYVGGFTGYVYASSSSITNINHTVKSVEGKTNVGGFAGYIQNVNNQISFNKLTVNADSVVGSTAVGGLSGKYYVSFSNESTIFNYVQLNANTIQSTAIQPSVGGLFGEVMGTFNSTHLNHQLVLRNVFVKTNSVGVYTEAPVPETTPYISTGIGYPNLSTNSASADATPWPVLSFENVVSYGRAYSVINDKRDELKSGLMLSTNVSAPIKVTATNAYLYSGDATVTALPDSDAPFMQIRDASDAASAIANLMESDKVWQSGSVERDGKTLSAVPVLKF